MLALIVVVVVVYLYAKTAKEKGRNPISWGIIGFLAYSVPVFLVNKVIWSWTGLHNFWIVAIINVVIGAFCAYVVKKAILDQR